MLEKQISSEEESSYPEVDVRCEDCQKAFSGKIGPLDKDTYPLNEYIWPNNPLLHALLAHHNTVRHFSNGHNSFHVYQADIGTLVGKVKVSTSAQLFVRIKNG